MTKLNWKGDLIEAPDLLGFVARTEIGSYVIYEAGFGYCAVFCLPQQKWQECPCLGYCSSGPYRLGGDGDAGLTQARTLCEQHFAQLQTSQRAS
jgi:hypothetical protein